jgi:hypothetical protein
MGGIPQTQQKGFVSGHDGQVRALLEGYGLQPVHPKSKKNRALAPEGM